MDTPAPLTSPLALESDTATLLGTYRTVAEAARLFAARTGGQPLDGLVNAFNLNAQRGTGLAKDPDIFHAEAYGRSLNAHFVALARTHEALCHQRVLMDHALPGITIPPLAHSGLDREIERMYETASFMGHAAMHNLRDTGDILEAPDHIAEAIGTIMDDLETHQDATIPAPRTGPEAAGLLAHFSAATANAYAGLVRTELDELRLELGYYTDIYGTGKNPRRPLHGIVRIFDRDDYADIAAKQIRLTELNQHRRLMFVRWSIAGQPKSNTVN